MSPQIVAVVMFCVVSVISWVLYLPRFSASWMCIFSITERLQSAFRSHYRTHVNYVVYSLHSRTAGLLMWQEPSVQICKTRTLISPEEIYDRPCVMMKVVSQSWNYYCGHWCWLCLYSALHERWNVPTQDETWWLISFVMYYLDDDDDDGLKNLLK